MKYNKLICFGFCLVLMILCINSSKAQEDLFNKNQDFFIGNNTVLYIKGNLLQDSGKFINNGTVYTTINITNINGTIKGSGRYLFIGTDTSAITPNVSDTFGTIIVNKSNSSAIINILGKVLVDTLKFNSDNLIVTDTNIIYVFNSDSNAIQGYGTNRYIYGILTREINSNQTKSYIFPVGDSIYLHDVIVEIDTVAGVNNLTVYFKQDTLYNRQLSIGGYDTLHPYGTWFINPDTALTPGDTFVYNLNTSTRGFNNLVDNLFSIVKRANTSTSDQDWYVEGTQPPDNDPGRMVSDGYARRTGLSSFSEFGIGIGFDKLGTPLNLKVFLEGPFDNNLMKMTSSDAYRDTFIHYVNVNPYGALPWNYSGLDSFERSGWHWDYTNPAQTDSAYFPDYQTTLPDTNIIDWVLIHLRSADSAQYAFDTIAALIRGDGQIVSITGDTIVLMDTTSLDSFYVVIDHRNHLSVMTKIKVGPTDGIYNWDFRDSLNSAYGIGTNYYVQLGTTGKFGMTGGNGYIYRTSQPNSFAQFKNVNSFDFNQWFIMQNIKTFGWSDSDFNFNLNTQFDDMVIWNRNSGAASGVHIPQ